MEGEMDGGEVGDIDLEDGECLLQSWAQPQ